MNTTIAESRAAAACWLDGSGAILVNPDQAFHPASTVKICIMMEAFRQARARQISLEEGIPIRNEFHSVADGNPYALNPADDSDQELYRLIGETRSRRELVERMITRSSNLAANLLLGELDARRVTAYMRQLGGKGLIILRGLEDERAYRLGMNNSATASGFMAILLKLARGEVVSAEDSAEMTGILSRQRFNQMIPAGLPAGLCVAHKTGWTADCFHDVGIVYPREADPFVLCILTKGYLESEEQAAHAFVAALAKTVFEYWYLLRDRAI